MRTHLCEKARDLVAKSLSAEPSRAFFLDQVTGLNNVCACAAYHGARSLGITTSRIKMAAFSKFCEWPPVFRQKGVFA